MSHQSDLIAARHPRLPEIAGGEIDAALYYLRQRRRRQEHPHRAPAVGLEADLRGPARRPAGRQQARRHAGGGDRLRAAARRAAGRTRAGDHHRCRLPLLLHRQAQVHRRRYARARAVHPQHGHRRLHRAGGGHSHRCPQGGADPDPAAQLSGLAGRHPQRRGGDQQDGPGRLQRRTLSRHRGGIPRLRRPTRFRRDRLHPPFRLERGQRHRCEL